MSTALRPALAEALDALYPGARTAELAADASARRFHRLFLPDGGTRVVMDYGAPFEGETDDVRLGRIFERAALPVARVDHVLAEVGALVVEDLGDVTLEVALTSASAGGRPGRAELYASAVKLAAEIATRGTDALSLSDRAMGPALDAERFLFEMRYFLENYVGAFLDRPKAATAARSVVEELALRVAAHPRVLCHRDYHSRNLMVRDDGALFMVDIQDARWGPDTYDLASLLWDAYSDVSDPESADLSLAYWRLLPSSTNPAEFRERLKVVAAQRMIKALGTFGYQVGVLGRERYRSSIPPTLERLAVLLPASAETAALGEVFLREGLLDH